MKIRVFNEVKALDAFIVTPEFEEIAAQLGLVEWNPVVWLGRLFSLDNDYGEHWFDNWDLRDELQPQAEQLQIPTEKLMVIDPDRFKNDLDGPCHPPELRKAFWHNVLASLTLDLEFLFKMARYQNAQARQAAAEQSDDPFAQELPLGDLEARIQTIRQKYEK
jgi:hypothetical protein